MTERQKRWQGMNWIRQESRLAIYLRDGLSCCWCGSSVEEGVQLTLDHLIPVSAGGCNKPNNLITCCKKCNDSRGSRPLSMFAEAVSQYIGVPAEEILDHIEVTRSRPIPRAEAKEIIARRGSVSKFLARVAPEKLAS